MKKMIYLFFALCFFARSASSQLFSLTDTTLTFKNQEGKILSKAEMQELMKGIFSIRQQIVDGKKVITVIPAGNEQVLQQQAKLDAFTSSLLDKPIAPFHLTDLNNKTWDSKDLAGRVVVINFWFTACKPCIQEMPHLNDLADDHKNDSVVFIAAAPDKEDQVRNFLAKVRFDYNIVAASGDWLASMNVQSFPTNIVVDKQGVVREVIVGYIDDIKGKLQQEIDKLQ